MAKASDGLLAWLEEQPSTLPEETVHVPEWKRDVLLRGLSSYERDQYETENVRRADAKAGNGSARQLLPEPDYTNFRARLVSVHIIENGERTFANPRGEELLGRQPAAVLRKLFTVSQRLSGFSQDEVEDLRKNFAAIPESEPSTASQGSPVEPSAS